MYFAIIVTIVVVVVIIIIIIIITIILIIIIIIIIIIMWDASTRHVCNRGKPNGITETLKLLILSDRCL